MGSYADGYEDGAKGIEKVRKQREEANERILKLEEENRDLQASFDRATECLAEYIKLARKDVVA